MKISPLDIRNKRFEKRWGRGVGEEEVRVYLDAVASELEGLSRDNSSLKESVKKAEAGLDEFREREKALKDTLVLAQNMKDEIRANALREAESVISEARIQADQIVASAHARLKDLLDQINELKGQRTQFLASLHATLQTHAKVLEISEHQMLGRDGADDRLAVPRLNRLSSDPKDARGR